MKIIGFSLLMLTFFFLSGEAGFSKDAPTLMEQNEVLLNLLEKTHQLGQSQRAGLRAIFTKSGYIGQGNPAITKHPVTPAECEVKLQEAKVNYDNPSYLRICGSRYMAPLYKPSAEKPENATTCIDQFEFPNIPCTYPVVWARAKEASEVCEALGKRICDAHEWEGACAGSLEAPDYHFKSAQQTQPEAAVRLMRDAHNRAYSLHKTWSYGLQYQNGLCASNSIKSPGCTGGDWKQCGSNTYPTGFFPKCKSQLDVYDLHGNAAEHMNLPLSEAQMASRGSKELGYTEMKGSWFIFDKYRAHEDWCRWRAPFWHGSRVLASSSHHNYHLGFRCCKTISSQPNPQ